MTWKTAEIVHLIQQQRVMADAVLVSSGPCGQSTGSRGQWHMGFGVRQTFVHSRLWLVTDGVTFSQLLSPQALGIPFCDVVR